MKGFKGTFFALTMGAAMALSGCAAQSMAAQDTARLPGSSTQAGSYAASFQPGPRADKPNPGKDDKGNNGKGNQGKGNNGKGNDGKGNNGNGKGKAKANQGNAGDTLPASQGNGRPDVATWWQSFSSRLFGGQGEAKQGGWQLGRFKDAFPFAYPPGWTVRERGDALLMTGSWQNRDVVFQLTRSVQVRAGSLQEWVSGDLQRMGIDGANVRYAQAGNVQIAVVGGVKDPDYACPVAYVYLWTANPAGRNQRQALGVVSQAEGAACDPQALSAFVDAYLAQVGGTEQPVATPVRPEASPTAAATQVAPTATPSPAGAGWQQTRFFNAFSFAYPEGWTMDRLGDTAHLQGDYQGNAYLADMVWVRDAPEVGVEEWARADLADLGIDMQGVRLDYTSQGNSTQIAMASGVKMQGYQCPAVRMYIVADNPAGGGKRGYTATVAQANGQTCNPSVLEDLAAKMTQPK